MDAWMVSLWGRTGGCHRMAKICMVTAQPLERHRDWATTLVDDNGIGGRMSCGDPMEIVTVWGGDSMILRIGGGAE